MNREQPTAVRGRLNLEIASGVVRAHKRAAGRGPTRAQAFYHHNVVVVLMHDPLTASERTLTAAGEANAVLRQRSLVQEAMRDDLVAVVQDLTGCTVEAFMSTNHIDPDLAVELFVLDRDVPPEPATTVR